MRKPLKSLRIVGKDYKVNFLPVIDGAVGLCHDSDCEIDISLAQDEQQIRDTLLHEAMHAIDYAMQAGMSEHQVHTMSSGLIALLRDNPKFAAWLLGR